MTIVLIPPEAGKGYRTRLTVPFVTLLSIPRYDVECFSEVIRQMA